MAQVHYVQNPAAIAELLRGPSGPVYKDILRKANLVKKEAQRLAPVSHGQRGGRNARAPGTLRNSIVVRIRPGGSASGVVAEVGTDDKVGLFVHEGTVPHRISAVNGRHLVFFWDKAGKVVAFPHVNHPGTKPNRFLLDALGILRGT